LKAVQGAPSLYIDAIWSEVECRITVHFTALNGYANTLILIGFAGTIFGSIGAFNEMFQGLARGEASAMVFVSAWNNGLATALYTSLGAAAIGGTLVTLLCSRFLMTRAKRLETMVGLRISEIIEEEQSWPIDAAKAESPLKEPKTPGKDLFAYLFLMIMVFFVYAADDHRGEQERHAGAKGPSEA